MSGGDVVVQALKSYGIATVVGARTWVRGVDLKYDLVDGTLVAQPKYARASGTRWRAFRARDRRAAPGDRAARSR
jgi:hypothetical protein